MVTTITTGLCCRCPLTDLKEHTIMFQTLELRGADTSAIFSLFQPIKEPLIPDMDTDNYRVKRITGYPCPVLFGTPKQLRQVRLQPIPTGVFTADAIVTFLQCQEVVVDIFKVIEHVTHAHILRMVADLFFVGSAMLFSFFHGVSRLTSLAPNQWVGPTRNLAVTLVMSVQRDTPIKPQKTRDVKCFLTLLSHTRGRTSSHYPKVRVSSPYFR